MGGSCFMGQGFRFARWKGSVMTANNVNVINTIECTLKNG